MTGEVCTTLEEMINIHVVYDEKEQERHWFSKDNEAIAPYMSMQKNQLEIEAESEKFVEPPNKLSDQQSQAQDANYVEGHQAVRDETDNSDHTNAPNN